MKRNRPFPKIKRTRKTKRFSRNLFSDRLIRENRLRYGSCMDDEQKENIPEVNKIGVTAIELCEAMEQFSKSIKY